MMPDETSKSDLVVKVGSTIVVEGTAYVIEGYTRTVNREGASVNIFAVDLMVGIQKELERKAKFSQMEMITGDALAVLKETRKMLEDEKRIRGDD